ncbi:hypothetical protein [Fodinicurvata fenggangensis]|uniref:hypothetical protein n=1 Tax=Fodinicurvata fenggangensis TaxID=1121830 RepID=UPI00047E747F|nr:hypothetical protein [Fodinicurvata fenggangensis]
MTASILPVALEIASLRTAIIAARVATQRQQQVLLVSTPDAAAQAGSLWFIEIARQTASEVPEAEVSMVLDCGDTAGYALEALHSGAGGIIFRGQTETTRRLQQLADLQDALFLMARPRCLFLDREPDPLAACRAWFWFREEPT